MLRDPCSWLSTDVEHRLHRVKVAEEVGDQSKDIVRDACPVRELRDDEPAADLGKEHVSFAKFVPAGDYFDLCQHGPAHMIQFTQSGLKVTAVNDLGKLRQGSKWGYLHHMINPAQCKMARAALGWSTRELAKRARVGSNTVARFENGRPANVSTVTLIQQAFEAAGIEFLNHEAPGVRLHPKKE